MDNQGTRVTDPVVDPVVGSTVRDRVATPTYVAPMHIATQHDEGVLPVRNRVQWGPIIAGLVSALAIFILLTILGFGIGASVLDPAQAGEDAGIWATIWGAITVILAFFVGGWIAAKTAAVGGEFGGMMNGLLVGITGVLLVIWMTASGLGTLFGLISSNIGDVANLAEDVAQQQGVTPEEAQQEAEQTASQVEEEVQQIEPETAFEAVRNGAIGTFLGLLLPIIAAGIGGYIGHNTRYELATGTGNP
jgi:hypothetical protein